MPDIRLPRLGNPLFGEIAIIGLGLIGSSIARAVRETGLAGRIVATDKSPAVRGRIVELGLADQVTETGREAVRDADMVVVCVPVGACGTVARDIAPALRENVVVTDVGSVKGAVIKEMAPHLPVSARLIPAHPVAGTENSGPEAGFATLFLNRWCIITPPDGAAPEAIQLVRDFWESMGSIVEVMTPERHDLVLAVTSHLPHLIAYNIVGTADDLEKVTRSEVIKFSAGGFRDFTRIAASDPTMWRDVFLHNREAVLEVLARFNEDLAALARAIRWGDGEKLEEVFSRTRAIRRGIVALGQAGDERDKGKAPNS